ncbi:MAG: peptidylprolyl isomerase, partial [Xanthobacteraceae bacterium]
MSNLSYRRREAVAAALLVAALTLAVPSVACAQQVVVFVNGTPITNLDVEHRAKFIQLSTKKVTSRKEALDSLIDEILEVNEAKRFSIDVPDSEVD